MIRVKIEAVTGSTKGNYRKTNQDRLVFNGMERKVEEINEAIYHKITKDKLQMYAVFDGLGGESYGGEAASVAAGRAAAYREQLLHKMPRDLYAFLQSYFKEANEDVCRMAKAKGTLSSGTTAAIICLYHGKFYCGNIGDSRIYLMRQGKMQQLSVDHTEEALMAKLNLSEEGRRKVRSSGRLTQYLGIEAEEMQIEPYLFEFSPQKGDMILLCSDGLTEKLEDQVIESILLQSKDSVENVKCLMECARQRKSRDNITVILLKVHRSLF